MRSQLFTTFMLVGLVAYVHCGCDEKDSEDGDVTSFFKNLGCDIKKGAVKISDTAKPWVDEVGKSAKKFGGTVADTFTDLKDKIAGAPDNSTVKTDAESGDKTTEKTSTLSASSSTPSEPASIDDRFLLGVQDRCPEGKRVDERGICRPAYS